MCLQYKSLENTVGKGEIARDEQFLLFPHCFLPFRRPFCYFDQIQNFRVLTLSVWKSLKSVVWERVNQSEFDQIQNFRVQTLSVWKSLKSVVWERVNQSVKSNSRFSCANSFRLEESKICRLGKD